MNTKHTPGPWRATTPVGSGPSFIKAPDCSGIAKCYADHRSTKEANANARLIAAAPELLTDLQNAQRIINEYIAAHQGDEGAPDEVAAYNALVKFFAPSIAKATGTNA